MNTKKGIFSLVAAVLVSGSIYAREDIGTHQAGSHRALATGCAQDEGSAFLAVNNVRARIMDEGDMWWNPSTNQQEYIVPASGKASAEFAGALWIGGLDAGGQLKLAAMTYRQNGEDFWTGPLDTVTVSITPSECAAYDNLYPVNRLEVQNFVANPTNAAYLTADIKNWPGNGNPAYKEGHYLAPFVDVGGTGTYDPSLGDYPGYDLKGKNATCQNELFGDATLWWVINDEGNVHTESGGIAIGLEIRCQAFAFQTNDAINDMTFYNYQVINRSSYQINQTYFGAWNDFDLGDGAFNFTGCDVGRSMGYGYESQNTNPDGSGQFAGEVGYHNDLPAIGEVFFQGPEADKNDTNCYVHAGKIGMARFVYYNNDFSVMGNPTNVTHYYNYLKGLWTDGTPMTYGGNGYQSSSTPCSYMFPWTPQGVTGTATNTDPTGCGTNHVVQNTEWDEVAAHDPGGDRRFIESAGPFTLLPGAVNYITTGEVFDITPVLNNQYLSIGLIQPDADLAQSLFNNCFKVLNGPDAPDLTIQELKNELIITISNAPTSNNYKEEYKERDPQIVAPYSNHAPFDTNYVFEGYEIFQVLDSSVAATNLLDPAQARLVAECDINDGVAQLVNYTFNPALAANVPTLEVTKNNKGIVHSFDIKADQFQEDGQPTLVDDRPYYFIAIAYGYNNYCNYNPLGPDSLLKNGQKVPFLQGRRNTKVYTGIPHIPNAQGYGTVQNSAYGEQPAITRIEGHGNGNNAIDIDNAGINYILANDTMAHPTYVAGQGPINVKIVDPLSVPPGNFIIKVVKGTSGNMDSTTRWKIYQPGFADTVFSDTTIGFQNEQVIPQWGISVEITDVDALTKPLYKGCVNMNVLDSSSSMTFADPTKDWLTGEQNAAPGINPKWWIRCGTYIDPGPTKGGTTDLGYSCTGAPPADPNCDYSEILGGTWAPYYMCAESSGKLSCDNGPKWSNAALDYSSLAVLSSVDIIITSDKSKWTRCPVLEEQDQPALAEGGALKLNPRNSPSVDQDGNYAANGASASSNAADPAYISPTGMGWFPGYAINVETGERLNMAFGEDSWLVQDSGRNMKWDPDTTEFRPNNSSYFGIESVFGGKHYIYVFGHNSISAKNVIPFYDEGAKLMSEFAINTNTEKAKIFSDAMWVNIPLLKQGHQLMESDVTIKLRVAKPYATNWGANLNNNAATPWANTSSPDNNNYPMYEFSTSGLEVETSNDSAAKAALNLINIVPNPYYGYSSYESNKIDTRVRITNLPPTCSISIFSVNGALINVINKQNPSTYVDWNLQNQFNVPIASGLYVLYINVPNVGSKTLKWFGVMRPLDLNSY